MAVFLEDADQHPRVRQRIELTASLVEPEAAGTVRLESRGFTAVERPAALTTGVYCLTPAAGVTVAPSSPIASVDWSRSNGSDLLVEPLGKTIIDCPVGMLEVHTFKLSAGTFQPTNDASFSVLLP